MHEFDSKNGVGSHKEFIKWIQNNPSGYVLNIKGKLVMLHRATCLHFRPYEGYGRANNPKQSSLDKHALETWAINRGLVLCSSCM